MFVAEQREERKKIRELGKRFDEQCKKLTEAGVDVNDLLVCLNRGGLVTNSELIFGFFTKFYTKFVQVPVATLVLDSNFSNEHLFQVYLKLTGKRTNKLPLIALSSLEKFALAIRVKPNIFGSVLDNTI